MATAPAVTIDLNSPLKWTAANPDELRMLRALQGNILKGHGRHFIANIFVTFGSDARASRRWLRDIADHHVTDAYAQLLSAKRYKECAKPGGDFCHVAISFAGYQAIGLAFNAPADPEFRRGMADAGSVADLHDPAVSNWESMFQKPLHVVVLAASETEATCARLTAQLVQIIEDGGGKVQVQHGKQLFNAAGEGIEHFGYVDGRSQPLMLVEDIEAEAGSAGTSRWDPRFPLRTALVPDPAVTNAQDAPFSFGSYFVFRKLEQHVRDFKTREQEIADVLGLKESDRELAGAMIVGRFEDGTPVTMSNVARATPPPNDASPPNDFDYDGDAGARCPFHAHIRKSNPRGSGGFGQTEAQEREHLMARRGITYEDQKRQFNPEELPEAGTLAEFNAMVAPKLPTGGVGLLFMAYNNVIGNQFKFTQQSWVNADNFPGNKPNANNGIDPVIGQADSPGSQCVPIAWDEPGKGISANCKFMGFVQMKGGEYFFSPSLTFLKSL